MNEGLSCNGLMLDADLNNSIRTRAEGPAGRSLSACRRGLPRSGWAPRADLKSSIATATSQQHNDVPCTPCRWHCLEYTRSRCTVLACLQRAGADALAAAPIPASGVPHRQSEVGRSACRRGLPRIGWAPRADLKSSIQRPNNTIVATAKHVGLSGGGAVR